MANGKTVLEEWLSQFKRYERAYWTNKIAEGCEVSKLTVYFWINGKRPVKSLYQKIINNVTGQEIFKV